MAKKKQKAKAKKRPAKKQPAKKISVKKRPAKKHPPKPKKKQPKKQTPPKKQPTPKPKLHPLTDYEPGICQDFPASDNGVVYFQNIPTGGCTLSQVNANSYFPFSPYTTDPTTQLRSTTLYPGDSTTVVVPDINDKQYHYNVSCCPLDEATHTVTVNS